MINTLYEKLLNNANQMLLACESKEWEIVAEQQEQHLMLINQIKQQSQNESFEDIQMIQRLLKMTQEIIKQVEQQQNQLSKTLLESKRQKKQSQFYQQ